MHNSNLNYIYTYMRACACMYTHTLFIVKTTCMTATVATKLNTYEHDMYT